MKSVQVTSKKRNIITSAFVDDADHEYVSQFRWSLNNNGYAQARVLGVMTFMHHLIVKPPVGMCIDHLDGNKLMNTRANCQIRTASQNARNRSVQKNNKAGARGVSLRYSRKGIPRYVARIEQQNLGTFDTLEEAFAVRRVAEIARGDGKFQTALHRCIRAVA